MWSSIYIILVRWDYWVASFSSPACFACLLQFVGFFNFLNWVGSMFELSYHLESNIGVFVDLELKIQFYYQYRIRNMKLLNLGTLILLHCGVTHKYCNNYKLEMNLNKILRYEKRNQSQLNYKYIVKLNLNTMWKIIRQDWNNLGFTSQFFFIIRLCSY